MPWDHPWIIKFSSKGTEMCQYLNSAEMELRINRAMSFYGNLEGSGIWLSRTCFSIWGKIRCILFKESAQLCIVNMKDRFISGLPSCGEKQSFKGGRCSWEGGLADSWSTDELLSNTLPRGSFLNPLAFDLQECSHRRYTVLTCQWTALSLFSWNAKV